LSGVQRFPTIDPPLSEKAKLLCGRALTDASPNLFGKKHPI